MMHPSRLFVYLCLMQSYNFNWSKMLCSFLVSVSVAMIVFVIRAYNDIVICKRCVFSLQKTFSSVACALYNWQCLLKILCCSLLHDCSFTCFPCLHMGDKWLFFPSALVLLVFFSPQECRSQSMDIILVIIREGAWSCIS